jgi:bifunctional non-homologous end joining protein LigD
MASMPSSGQFDVAGRRLTIRNLDRVVFPRAGTTKADILGYYTRVADTILAHLRGRPLHMHRYPEGVEGPRFWQKACPEHRPTWVQTVPVWSRDKRSDIEFCVIDELATLVWAVNIGSLELHTSLHTRDALHRPTVLAFDLDPGEGVDVLACGAVALRLREALAGIGLHGLVKTSGSKGLQVYVPLNTDVTYDVTKPLARRIAELLEAERPEGVTSRMGRHLRAGRVLVDWGQNTEHKSMVCAYSVRARRHPTVSTPVTWEELEAAVAAGDPAALVFELDDVVRRLDRHGDLFGDVLRLEQRLG